MAQSCLVDLKSQTSSVKHFVRCVSFSYLYCMFSEQNLDLTFNTFHYNIHFSHSIWIHLIIQLCMNLCIYYTVMYSAKLCTMKLFGMVSRCSATLRNHNMWTELKQATLKWKYLGIQLFDQVKLQSWARTHNCVIFLKSFIIHILLLYFSPVYLLLEFYTDDSGAH